MSAHLYALYHDAIERTLARVCRRLDQRGFDAEDLAQDLRLHFIQKGAAIVQAFRGASSFETYLFRVFFNCGLSWFHAHQVAEAGTVAMAGFDLDRLPAASESDDALVIERENLAERREQLIRDALLRLPWPDKHVLRCRLLGYPMAEVAEALGMTRDAAYSRYHRTVRMLRMALREPKAQSRSSGGAAPGRGAIRRTRAKIGAKVRSR